MTILTDPVPTGTDALPEHSRRIARKLRDLIARKSFADRRYRGHFAVTRSAVEGLQKIGIPTTHNPIHLRDVAPVVVVLSGVCALKQAIAWKRSGRIRRLIAGPNIVNTPMAKDSILCSREIDLVITPSRHVSELYISLCPSLADHIGEWAAGVDASFWKRESTERAPRRVVWFEKAINWSQGSTDDYREMLKIHGFDIIDIVYGKYRPTEFLQALRSSSALISFVDAESQGIAWTESWAADVPTLLWFQEQHIFRDEPALAGRVVRTSPAPYLTAATGAFFTTVSELENALQQWQNNRDALSPRAWVLSNMTDEVCATRLLELAAGQSVTANLSDRSRP